MPKMRLQVWGYTKSEYLCMLVNGGLTLKYETYTIKSQDNPLEARKIQQKELILNAKHGIWQEEKKQKGGFLPILRSLEWWENTAMAGAVGGKILKGLGSKISERGKRRSKRRRKARRLSYA